MDLSEKDKNRIEEEEVYREKLREEEKYRQELKDKKQLSLPTKKNNTGKTVLIVLIILMVFGFISSVNNNGKKIIDDNISLSKVTFTPTAKPITTTPQEANPLSDKFRQLHFLKDNYYTIRGVQFHPGQPSDELVEKIGKPVTERHTTDHEYGLVAEYKYENSTAMIAKIPFIANYFIIYAIYSNEKW